jgi:hypothetical protein
MRISSIIGVLENQVIGVSGKLAAASKTLYVEASQEARARALYNAETRAEREARLIDLRHAVKAVDALSEARASGEFAKAVQELEIDDLRAQLAAAKAEATPVAVAPIVDPELAKARRAAARAQAKLDAQQEEFEAMQAAHAKQLAAIKRRMDARLAAAMEAPKKAKARAAR